MIDPFELDASRREFLAKLMALSAVAPLGGVLAACGGGDGGGGDDLAKVATPEAGSFTGPRKQRRNFLDQFYTLQNDYFKGWDRGSQEAAAILNMKYTRGVDNANVDNLRSAFEQAGNKGIEGISVLPNTAAASPQILGIAQRQQIYVSSNWSNAPWSTPFDIGEYFYSYQSGNDVAGAREVAKLMFEELGGNGKVIQIEGIRGNSASDNRTRGFNEALKEFPGIEVVARQPGNFDRVQTQPVIENVLTANPDVDGVWVANDDSAIAVVNALQQRGSDALVTGIDAISEFLTFMKQGKNAFASWGHHGGWIGAFSTVRVFDALNGHTLTPPERMMYFGGFIIDTPEAADAYDKLMYKSSKFPFDYEKWSRVLHPDDWDVQNDMVPIDPAEYWADTPEGAGNSKGDEEFEKAKASGQVDEVTQMYKDHFKDDPWADIKKLTKNGGANIV